MQEGSLFENVDGVDTTTLEQVGELCKKQKVLMEEVKVIEESLKAKKKDLEKVSREDIPRIFNSAGLTRLDLATGETIEIKEQLKASIANKNYLLAYRNMVNAEGGDETATTMIDALFKSELVIENASDELMDMLLNKEISYENKKTIHHATLKSYCKNRLESGESVPEGISVYQYQEAKIK